MSHHGFIHYKIEVKKNFILKYFINYLLQIFNYLSVFTQVDEGSRLRLALDLTMNQFNNKYDVLTKKALTCMDICKDAAVSTT